MNIVLYSITISIREVIEMTKYFEWNNLLKKFSAYLKVEKSDLIITYQTPKYFVRKINIPTLILKNYKHNNCIYSDCMFSNTTLECSKEMYEYIKYLIKNMSK